MVVVLQSKFMSRDICKGRLVKENHQQKSSWMTILVHGVVLTRKLNIPPEFVLFQKTIGINTQNGKSYAYKTTVHKQTKTSLNEVFQYRTTCECEEGRGAMV